MERPGVLKSGLLGILVDVLVDTLDEGVLESLIDLVLSPWVDFLLDCLSAGSLELLNPLLLLLGVVNDSLNVVVVGGLVEDDLIEEFSELFVDVLVDGDHTGFDDTHVHSLLDGVVKEH